MEQFTRKFRHEQDAFPNRSAANTRKTSDDDVSYNCFGWVIGKLEILSWTSGSLWPEDAPRNFLIDSMIKVYEFFGFERCDNDFVEADIEKIAIYADGGIAVHAALQTANGKWSSKLGLAEDVEHDDLTAIAGGVYGQVACLMKRPRAVPDASAHPLR